MSKTNVIVDQWTMETLQTSGQWKLSIMQPSLLQDQDRLETDEGIT